MRSLPSPPSIVVDLRRAEDDVVAAAAVERGLPANVGAETLMLSLPSPALTIRLTVPLDGRLSVPAPGSKSVLLANVAGRGRQVVRDVAAG